MKGDVYSRFKNGGPERRETLRERTARIFWQTCHRLQVDMLQRARSKGGKAAKRREKIYRYVQKAVQANSDITAEEVYRSIDPDGLEVHLKEDGRIYQDDGHSISESSLSRYLTKARSQLKSQ